MSTTSIEYRPFSGEAVEVEVDTLPLDCFECIDCGEFLPMERAAQVVPAPVDLCQDCLDERMGEYDWPPRFPDPDGGLMSRYFFVSSPDRDEVEPILDDGAGPIEPTCDVWEGTATTRAHARRQAWREWEKNWRSCVHINRSDGKHPMSGVSVVELLPCPVHGQRMGDGVALTLTGDEICDCEFEQAGNVIRWKGPNPGWVDEGYLG